MVLAHISMRMGAVDVPTLGGFRVSFLIATGAVIVGVALAAFLPSQSKTSRPTLVAQSTDGSEEAAGPAGASETAGAGDAGVAAPGPLVSSGTEPVRFTSHLSAERPETLAKPTPSWSRPTPTTVPQADPSTPATVGVAAREGASTGFRGRVLDTSGGPVPRASITLIDRQGRQAGVTTAGADGRYALTAPAEGTYVLTGAAAGHTPHAASATYRAGTAPVEVDLILTASGRLTGTLLGGPDGLPLAGAGVVVTDSGGDVVTRTTSGSDGTWEVSRLLPGTYTVVMSADGHRPEARAVELSGGEPARQDVRLHPAATVRGTVRGPDGRPLADAAVTLVEDGTVAAHTVTGPDGVFAFSELSGRHYTLSAAGYPPHAAPISVAGGATEVLDLDLVQPAGATG